MIQIGKKNRGARLLFVEDDKFLYLAYKYGLEKEGFEVRFVSDTEEGVLKEIGEFKPSIVLLDLIIQPKNGFEVLAEIKRDPEAKNIPVFVFSNLKQKEDIERCMALGAAEFFVKTELSRSQVIERLKSALQNEKL